MPELATIGVACADLDVIIVQEILVEVARPSAPPPENVS